MPPAQSDRSPRAGRCALVGRPNVGKSTLLNRVLGQSLAIVTPRPGTTRSRLLGVYSSDKPPTQIAFIDTPGFLRPESALDRVLVQEARAGVEEADVIVMLTEPPERGLPTELGAEERRVLSLVKKADRPAILAINKVDRKSDRSAILPLLELFDREKLFKALVPISARDGTQVDVLLDEIRVHLPKGVLFEPDFLTDRPERYFVSERIREAAMQHTRGEVPQGIAVTVDQFTEQTHLVRIHATIVVDRPSHKGIVIGARGAMMKKIATDARVAIEALVGKKVFLQVLVRVEAKWTENPDEARRLCSGEDP